MADSQTFDPFRSFKFVVDIGGGAATQIGFQKCTGLKEATDVVEYREGNTPIHKRKLPGLTNYDPITLTRGATFATAILDWRKLVARWGVPGDFDGVPTGADGMGFRRVVSIKVFDKGIAHTAKAARSWKVHYAWPSELSLSDLNAEASEVLIETMILQHEGLEPEPKGAASGDTSLGTRGG